MSSDGRMVITPASEAESTGLIHWTEQALDSVFTAHNFY